VRYSCKVSDSHQAPGGCLKLACPHAVGQERMEEEDAKYAKEQKRHGAAARPLWILKPTLGARGEL
jgi:hypothetical protein